MGSKAEIVFIGADRTGKEEGVNKPNAEDLMIPSDDYPTVSHSATLNEALKMLKVAQYRFGEDGKVPPRAVLVQNDDKEIIGKLSHWDVLRALEPKYRTMGDGRTMSHSGWSADFVKSMVASYSLLQNSLEEACRNAADLKVCDVMVPLSEKELLHHEKEIVEFDTPLNVIIHLLVLGNFMYLYVRKEGHIVGVIRLSDVVRMVIEKMVS